MKKGIIIGVVCGLLIGILGTKFFSGNRRYTVQIMNQYFAIKTDTQTGETWMLSLHDNKWHPIVTAPKEDIFDKVAREMEKTNH